MGEVQIKSIVIHLSNGSTLALHPDTQQCVHTQFGGLSSSAFPIERLLGELSKLKKEER